MERSTEGEGEMGHLQVARHRRRFSARGCGTSDMCGVTRGKVNLTTWITGSWCSRDKSNLIHCYLHRLQHHAKGPSVTSLGREASDPFHLISPA